MFMPAEKVVTVSAPAEPEKHRGRLFADNVQVTWRRVRRNAWIFLAQP